MVSGPDWRLSLTGYHATWNATDQVPQRAIDSGLIDRFGNIDPALAAIGSAHDRATADLLGVFSPRGATSVDIRLEAVLEDLKITMRDARVARIHRAEIRASIESGS